MAGKHVLARTTTLLWLVPYVTNADNLAVLWKYATHLFT